MSKKFAAIAFTSDGRQALRYFEPDGRDIIIHNIASFDGMAVDAAVSGFESLSDEKVEELRAVMIDGFDTEAADRLYQTIAEQIGEPVCL